MADIAISRGLDIPLKGGPLGPLRPLISTSNRQGPQKIALSLNAFSDLRLRILIKPGDRVKIGQPLAEDKGSPGRFFVAPAAGTIDEVRRAAKRVPHYIVIDITEGEEFIPLPAPVSGDRDALIDALLKGGHFASIRSRPFNRLADPKKMPRSIFVKALESAPFLPPAEMQVSGHEEDFQRGLDILSRVCDGPIHLVYRGDTKLKAFTEAKNVQKHSASGPHPIANSSLHIQRIDPIRSPEDLVWTINARDVVAIGHQFSTGRYYVDKIVSIAGPGVVEGQCGYYKSREGVAVADLIAGNVPKGVMRYISGDPLMGTKVSATDFLSYGDAALSIIPENIEREFMHFFRLGVDKYTFSKAYFSGHFKDPSLKYSFTTSQHGEHRAFIDSSLYDKVMPLEVPSMLLVRAVMAEDFDLACQLGLLEVDAEDFALPTFVCPSKMEMTEIIKEGLLRYSKEVLP